MEVFNYIYYRINQAYFKWDGRNGTTSIVAISMIQSMLIGDFFAIVLKQNFERDKLVPFAKMIAIIWAIVFLIFLIWNFFYYRNKYNFFKNKWKDESKGIRIIKGLGVFGALILPWLLFFLFVI